MTNVFEINTKPRHHLHRGIEITYAFDPETKLWRYQWEVIKTYCHEYKGEVKASSRKKLLEQIIPTIDHFLDNMLQPQHPCDK